MVVKINNKSDFKINESSETVAMEVPFVFSYYVFDSKKYVVSFDGHNYVNCERKEDGSLDVIFNQPEFGIGHLKVERKYAVDDKAFADGVFDVVTVDKTDVFITSGQTFETYVKTLVVPPYLKGDKGDPMTWETMTEKERGELVKDVAEAIDPEMVMTKNEKSRQEAEQSRQTAEQQRSTTFNTLKGEMQSAITAGNAAAGNAQKVVDNYDMKVAEQDSKLTELGQYVDAINIEDSEKDTLYVCDKNGDVIAIIDKNGIKTTKYSSPQFSIEDNGKSDFIICDENGNVVFKLDKNTNTYTMVKDKIVAIKNVPAISWIDDDFAIFNNSGEVLGIYQDIHDWCIDRNIRFDFALTPNEQKIEKAQEYEEEGFTFLLHPTHNGWYDYADGTVHDITKARKSLISCIRFFRKNLVSKANILVYPGSSDTYADNVSFISQYVECAIRATMEGSNQAAKNDKYKLTRLSLILDNVKTKTKTKELIRKYLENGDWVILYTHLYSWEVSDVVDETSLSSANLKEMIEYANSICPLKSTESIWEERKVMFNI